MALTVVRMQKTSKLTQAESSSMHLDLSYQAINFFNRVNHAINFFLLRINLIYIICILS